MKDVLILKTTCIHNPFVVLCIGSLNNKVFDILLELLREAFPYVIVGLPKSYYDVMKLMKELRLAIKKLIFVQIIALCIGKKNEIRTSYDTYHQLRRHTSDKDLHARKERLLKMYCGIFHSSQYCNNCSCQQ